VWCSRFCPKCTRVVWKALVHTVTFPSKSHCVPPKLFIHLLCTCVKGNNCYAGYCCMWQAYNTMQVSFTCILISKLWVWCRWNNSCCKHAACDSSQRNKWHCLNWPIQCTTREIYLPRTTVGRQLESHPGGGRREGFGLGTCCSHASLLHTHLMMLSYISSINTEQETRQF